MGEPKPPDASGLRLDWPEVPARVRGAVTAAVAAVAGFFTGEGLRPAPPGLPTLRAFQAAQGNAARA